MGVIRVKAVFMGSLFLVFSLFLLQFAAAQAVPPVSQSMKVTQWRVDVTEDESACGGGVSTKSRSVQIQLDPSSAVVGDWGHGKVQAAFVGNTISIPKRTIPDEAGSSTLSQFMIKFNPDCSSFSTKYSWDYRDSQMSCSGSTTLRGTRTDGKGCPETEEETKAKAEDQEKQKAADLRTELEKAHADPNQESKENRYKEVLAKDPKNFWANWDMAELKKKQGDYKEYFDYFDKAVSNPSTTKITGEILRGIAIKKFHLSEPPTTANSLLLKSAVDNELKGWEGGRIYNVDLPKEEKTNWEKFKIKIWATFVPNAGNIAYEAAGLQGETK